MPRGNPTPVRSIRVNDALWARVVAAAESDGMTVTDWITETLRRRVARRKPDIGE